MNSFCVRYGIEIEQVGVSLREALTQGAAQKLAHSVGQYVPSVVRHN
jgi:hypothetical protein